MKVTNEEKTMVLNYLNRPKANKKNRPQPMYTNILYSPFSDEINISYLLEENQEDWEMSYTSYSLLVESAKLFSL